MSSSNSKIKKKKKVGAANPGLHFVKHCGILAKEATVLSV